MRSEAHPFSSLPKVRRSELRWAAAMRRAFSQLSEVDKALGRLLEVQCHSAFAAAAKPVAYEEITRPEQRTSFFLVSDHGAKILVEPEPLLSGELLARLLGQDADDKGDGFALSEVERGILLYLAGRLLAETRLDHDWRAVTTFQTPEAIAKVFENERVGTVKLNVVLDEHPFFVRVLFSERALSSPERDLTVSASATAFERFDAFPVKLVIHGGFTSLTQGEIASLEPGDIVMPARPFSMEELIVITLDRGRAWRARWEPPGGLILTNNATFHERRDEGEIASMKVSTTNSTPADPVTTRDIPIELAVELARIALRVDEVAALGAGDVIRTNVRIGESVKLRAGETTVAIGELVDVEGELGIRVTRVGPIS